MAVPLRSPLSRSRNFLAFASRFDLPSFSVSISRNCQWRKARSPESESLSMVPPCHQNAASPGRGKMAQKSVRPTLRPSPATPALPAATFPENRRRTLIIKEPQKPGPRLAEVAGSTAAGCAAICCCPCGLANLIVVVPAGLVRRWRKRWPRGAKTKSSIWRPEVDAFYDDDDDLSLYLGGSPLASSGSEEPWLAKSLSPELAELEKEMVAKFYGTGFWRSLSQRSQ